MIKFSVIIPTFNRAHVLSRAIESVLSQSYPHFEIIVIDDGSTDETQNVLSKYPRIKILKTINQGVSAARNVGINIACNPWICFLDSDDEWLESKLQLQAKFLTEHPSFKIVHGEEIWIRNGVRVNPMKKHQKGGGDQFAQSLKMCVISPSTVCLHRELLEEFKGLDESFEVCEDYDLWLKITQKYPVGYIENELIKKYGGHEDQLSRKYKAMDYYRVKSMYQLTHRAILSSSQLEQLKKELAKKAKILLAGYQKHNNMTHFHEIQTYLAWASTTSHGPSCAFSV